MNETVKFCTWFLWRVYNLHLHFRLQEWVIIVLFVLLQFCIFNATCRKNTFRLYTCLGNKCLNWLCLNKGQCLCNLVAIWCLKVSFEIKSIVWIRDKTVNIQEKKITTKLQFLSWIKTLQYPHWEIHQFTTLHYFITTLHKKGFKTPKGFQRLGIKDDPLNSVIRHFSKVNH